VGPDAVCLNGRFAVNEKILGRIIVVTAFLIANCSGAEDGPVAHWTFDGTLDDQVAANHGVYTGGGDVSYAEGFDGKERGAIRLNGVDFANVPRIVKDEMTIACWVRLDTPQVMTGSGDNFVPVHSVSKKRAQNHIKDLRDTHLRTTQ